MINNQKNLKSSSALSFPPSPCLLVVVMDEIKKDVREEGIRELLYADDLVGADC